MSTQTSLDDLRSEIHVWFCRPEKIVDEDRLEYYMSLLSEQESDRLARFRYASDRHSYLVSHAMLRIVLSGYLSSDPQQLQFQHNANGKPSLVRQNQQPAVEFNLTHTDGLSACVITRDAVCGIDAEDTGRRCDVEALARRMFSAQELHSMESGDQRQQFFDLWTLREAYVKALGIGLAGSSKDFYFTLDAADGDLGAVSLHRTANTDPEKRGHDDWQFQLFSPTGNHRLAIAYSAADRLPARLYDMMP